MWESDQINCKWAPYLLYGPNVSEEDALEFIRRTDSMLNSEGFTNARSFEERLNSLRGEPKFENYLEQVSFENGFKKGFDYISLEHFGSHWVASAYIDGPNGPVHPDGRVFAAKNAGKYPSIESIENDLKKISDSFPNLEFYLYVWDNWSESSNGDPQFGWHLSNGSFERIKSLPTRIRNPLDIEASVKKVLTFGVEFRECTWTIEQIDRMWGDKIREASKVGLGYLEEYRVTKNVPHE